MKLFEPYAIKRAVFMFAVMFPILLVLEYTGKTSMTTTIVLAGVTAGVSVVLFPSPEFQKKNDKDKTDK